MEEQRALRAAFLAATYGTGEERFHLAAHPSTSTLSWAAGPWAIVTAWNPGGQCQAAADNRRAERKLLALIASRPYLCAVNGEGEWAEPSVILPGLYLRPAVDLGRRFGQAALLFGMGRRVALVWLTRDGVRVERFWMQPVEF